MPALAQQVVVAFAAEQNVVSRPAFQPVCACLAQEPVVSALPLDQVVPGRAVQGFVLARLATGATLGVALFVYPVVADVVPDNVGGGTVFVMVVAGRTGLDAPVFGVVVRFVVGSAQVAVAMADGNVAFDGLLGRGPLGRGVELEPEVAIGEGFGAGLVMEHELGLGVQRQYAGGVEFQGLAAVQHEFVFAGLFVLDEGAFEPLPIHHDPVPTAIDDGVSAVSPIDEVGVFSFSSFKGVAPLPPNQHVFPCAPSQGVGVGLPDQ
ncbi:hypothetical protein B9N43_04835 [Denitratisoma sp. DHT3]|nr:hypothetical protein B9N43_04835 [Denitratisoma sp. DHT3]